MTLSLKSRWYVSGTLNLFPGEKDCDELASRGCDPQIKVWNDPDVDWARAGMVVVRSVLTRRIVPPSWN